MTAETNKPLLAHVLFMDIVGFSKLPSDEQKRVVHRLQELVRASEEFQHARESDQVISLPTGDGMALAFFNKLDAAVVCAIEISKSIQIESLCSIRMGVHTGPVFVMEDINHKRNISGAGINRAERVMSCGDTGHILVSDQAAESLRHLSDWESKIREIGECQVKDGWIRVWNLVDGSIGNAARPRKSRRYARRRKRALTAGVMVLALSALAAVAGAFWIGRTKNIFDFGRTKSIAVMPFDDLSPEKNQEYFSDGLAEELLNALAKIPGLRVSGKTSSFQFKGKNEDCRVIGEKLHVGTLLEGSVRKSQNQARVTVRLIQTDDGSDIWSESFDRQMTDIFAVEEDIAKSVTGALRVRLLGGRAAPLIKATNADAYNAYLQGRYLLARRNKENLDKAGDYFNQALQFDSNYAPAWVGLAGVRNLQAGLAYVPVEQGYRQARESVQKAMSIDPNLGDAYTVFGTIQVFHDWDWAGADASYKRALALEPGDARTIRGAGLLAAHLGRLDQGINLFRKAIDQDPLNSNAYHDFGTILHYAGRQKEATAALSKALELAPEMVNAHGLLVRVYLAESRPQDALAEAEKEKHPVFRLLGLALAYQALGRKKEADSTLEELIAKYQADAPYQVAQVYAFRQEADKALEWLERAYAVRDSGLPEMKVDPLLKNLKNDPRYKSLQQKMQLPL